MEDPVHEWREEVAALKKRIADLEAALAIADVLASAVQHDALRDQLRTISAYASARAKMRSA